MKYEEFHMGTGADAKYEDAEPNKASQTPKKPDSVGKMAAKVLIPVMGFGLAGLALEQGQKEKDQRRAKIEEIRKDLAAEPELPFVTIIDPNDPEKEAKQAYARKIIEKKVELEKLKRITPEN